MEYKLCLTKIANAPAYLLKPSSAPDNALILHGYGGNKEEILGCALAVARAGFNVYVPDLPGHGEHQEKLNFSTIKGFVHGLKELTFKVVVGHSLGARLALLLPCHKFILLSPPWDAVFEGSTKELLHTLRVRRVKEEKYYAGLIDILTQLPKPNASDKKILCLYSKHDLATVKTSIEKGSLLGWKIEVIKDSFHNDIISSQKTFQKIETWLKD